VKHISYITLEMVLAIHESMVEQYGGSDGIRDLFLIQSAIARPQAIFGGEDLYQTVFEKAASLFHSLLFNHGFVDANKRTAIVSAAALLGINGYELKVTQQAFVAFPLKAEHVHLSIEAIASWFKEYTEKIV
jgi:death-on-curing protein